MKTAITVRLDPDLLEAVRSGALRENRSLTNFIETALKDRLRPEVEEPDNVQQMRPHSRKGSRA